MDNTSNTCSEPQTSLSVWFYCFITLLWLRVWHALKLLLVLQNTVATCKARFGVLSDVKVSLQNSSGMFLLKLSNMRKSVEVGVFRRGWVTLSADFGGQGASPTNHCWYQSRRVIALSCGIKISAVRHLVLSQCTRVTDRRSDRITTPKTALAYARAVKKGDVFLKHSVVSHQQHETNHT